MQYYSRSPKEVTEAQDRAVEKNGSIKRIGQIILFVDIIIILLILVYIGNKQNKKLVQETIFSENKEFSWKSYRFKAKCSKTESACTLNSSIGHGKEVQNLQWIIKNHNDKTVYSENQAMTVTNQMGLPKLNLNRYEVFISLQNGNKDELINFRVYP